MHSSDSAALDLPLPLRNFAATRRMLLVVLAASILFPIVFLLGYGYYDYQRRMIESNDIADRVARVADEQAVKVLDLNREISTRIVEMLADSDDAQIHANQKAIHDRLSAIGESFAQVAGITIFGVTGEMLASNRYFPVPAVSIADREDFTSARSIRPDPYFPAAPRQRPASRRIHDQRRAQPERRPFWRRRVDRAQTRLFRGLLSRFVEW